MNNILQHGLEKYTAENIYISEKSFWNLFSKGRDYLLESSVHEKAEEEEESQPWLYTFSPFLHQIYKYMCHNNILEKFLTLSLFIIIEA